MLRAPLERVIGARLADFVPHEAQAALAWLLLRGGRGDVALLALNGVTVPVQLSLSELPAAQINGARVLCGVLADLTEREARGRELSAAYGRLAREVAERERAEARLHQAQKMEALGQLSGGVVHDFNNSAAVVLAGLALLQKRHGLALAAAGLDVKRLLEGIKGGAERGAAVARRLLSFARREELRAADIDPCELLSGLREVLANTLGPGIRVRVEVPLGLPSLRADQPLLETTIINLAVNARDAMPNGGIVVLGAIPEILMSEQARVAGLTPGAYVRLWVADTGAGMDAATLARATEPFFTSKPKGRGTGLGLSMADGFAVQSGGALRIESTPCPGTTVTLWLSQARYIADHEAERVPKNSIVRRRVLVVDDVPVMRRFLQDCLGHDGWDVVEAADRDQALATLQADTSISLLITDFSMPPGPDGFMLIREARALYPTLHTILLSGSEALPERLLTAAEEQFLLLRKPVSPAELTEAIATLVDAMREASGLP